MTLSTLISLACAIADQGNVNTNEILEQLTDAEQAQVQAIVETGTCLPENMENLIKQTMVGNIELKNMGSGENISVMSHEPCDGCF